MELRPFCCFLFLVLYISASTRAQKAELNDASLNAESQAKNSTTERTRDCGSESCSPVNVPATVKPGTKVWGDGDIPIIDDIDIYWNNTLVCQYRGFNIRNGYFYTEERFEGNPIQRDFALRAPGGLRVTVSWRTFKPAEYWIDVGTTNNTQTKLVNNLNAVNQQLQTQNTPGILAGDKYTEFYVRVDKDNLTFGKKCENPIITHKIEISDKYMKEDLVYVKIEPLSKFGGKVIHHCPASSE